MSREKALSEIARLTALKSFEISKEEETQLFKAFAEVVCPRTYLADYLQGAVAHFTSLASQDLCEPMTRRIDELQEQIADLKRESAALSKRHSELNAAVRDAEQKLAREARRLRELGETADAVVRAVASLPAA